MCCDPNADIKQQQQEQNTCEDDNICMIEEIIDLFPDEGAGNRASKSRKRIDDFSLFLLKDTQGNLNHNKYINNTQRMDLEQTLATNETFQIQDCSEMVLKKTYYCRHLSRTASS